MQSFDVVRGVADRHFGALIDEERERLRKWRARIAAIGQVKAGKSTYLGALVGHANFLPSEVNPWTSVITNLNFGHPDDPDRGGEFHFFAEEDWNRVIEGDTQTRELAEELLPGFSSEVLKQQVESMRARARERLGRFYGILLGRSHRYDHITRDILDRYVCAGGDTLTKKRDGQYSDITERADLYFPAGKFALPTVVTDTPGVNDPFLVRDEFTCRSLQQSDIFILMLSAHQAMSEVDLSLIRLISAHPGKRIIVFINRIDELESYASEAPEIIEDVSGRIQDADVDAPIDIIVGSANWATMVTVPDPDDDAVSAAAESDQMDKLLKSYNGKAPVTPTERVRVASGLVRTEEALDLAIAQGSGAEHIRERQAALKSLVNAMIAQFEVQRAELADASTIDADKGSLAAAVLGSLSSRADAAAGLRTELEEVFERIKLSVAEVVDNAWGSIRRELDLVGTAFTEQQSAHLADVIESDAPGSLSYDFTTTNLRASLEAKATECHSASRHRLDQLLENSLKDVEQLTRTLLGDFGLNFSLKELPHETVMPMVSTSTQTLTLELTSMRGWKFWSNTSLDKDEAIQALKKIIRAEFYPSIESMNEIAHEALVERAAEAIRRLETLCQATVESISARVDDLKRSSRSDFNERTEAEVFKERLATELADIDAKLESLRAVDASLPG